VIVEEEEEEEESKRSKQEEFKVDKKKLAKELRDIMAQENIYQGMSATIKSMFFHPPDEVQDRIEEIDNNNQLIQSQFLKKQFKDLKIESTTKLTQKMVDDMPNVHENIMTLNSDQAAKLNI
jgi:hypothetical protein